MVWRLWSVLRVQKVKKYPSEGHFSQPFLWKTNWASRHINTVQRLLDYSTMVESLWLIVQSPSLDVKYRHFGLVSRAQQNLRLQGLCRYETITCLSSSFQSPSLSVSVLLRCSASLHLPCVICAEISLCRRWQGRLQNENNQWFPSNTVKLKLQACFENVQIFVVIYRE